MPALVKSNTPLSQKNEWRTPLGLYSLLNLEFDFQLDAAATADNTLCERYITPEDDALIRDWGDYGVRRVFCNPPFSRTKDFLAKGLQEFELYEGELEIVFLIRADGYETQWFRQLLSARRLWGRPVYILQHHVRQLTPRVAFNLASGSKPSHGPNFPSAVVIMSKHYPPGMYWWYWKDDVVEQEVIT